jgi:hypothetical protein
VIAPLPTLNVRFSCVVDTPPRFAVQALTWAASLLTYGGQTPESLVVHYVDECEPTLTTIFDAWGVATVPVQRFDQRHGPSNKLTQLESERLQFADYVVLCDCDTAFCAGLSSWIGGASIRACIAALRGPSAERWEYLFRCAELPLPPARKKAMLVNAETLPSYCNGGLMVIPQPLLQALREPWARWDRWVLDRPNLVDPYFADQISFAMACEQLGLSIEHLPLELNFHTGLLHGHVLQSVSGQSDADPMVLHYHQLGADGLLGATRMVRVNRQIERINDLIRWLQRTGGREPPHCFLLEDA